MNAFSLLADGYRIDAFEPVTDLCVSRSCLPNRLSGARRLRSFLRDATIVYGTLALPKRLADGLPRITDAWGGFAETTGFRPTLAKFRRFNHGPSQQVEVAGDFISRITSTERPTLHFLHLLLPHRPWQLLPDGSSYDDDERDAGVRYQMPDDPWLAEDEAARFALQAGAMDRVLGRIVRRLHEQGLWGSTVLIMTADHGVNLSPGSAARFPTDGEPLDDLFRVPLIFHTPGQTARAISDVPASTADILPTLLGVLGAPAPELAAGVSLTTSVPANRSRTVWTAGVGRPFESGTTTLDARVRRNAAAFPASTAGWGRLFARGPYAAMLGTRVPSNVAFASGHRARIVLPLSHGGRSDRSTSLVVARVSTPAGTTLADGSIVVVSHGIVVGFLGGGSHAPGGGDVRHEGVVDWRAAGDASELELYLASGPSTSPTLHRLARIS